MLLIEFEENITQGLNIVKYRNVEDDTWYYLYIDVETLHLLIQNFGIVSTKKMPAQTTVCIDNPSTCKHIAMTFCNAPINIYCGSNDQLSLAMLALTQNY